MEYYVTFVLSVSLCSAEDEEDTIAAQEKVEGNVDHAEELDDLAREGTRCPPGQMSSSEQTAGFLVGIASTRRR